MKNCDPFDCIKYWIEFHRCLPASNKTVEFTSLTSPLLKPSPRYRCKFRVIFHFKFPSINSSAFPSVPTSPGDKAPILFTPNPSLSLGSHDRSPGTLHFLLPYFCVWLSCRITAAVRSIPTERWHFSQVGNRFLLESNYLIGIFVDFFYFHDKNTSLILLCELINFCIFLQFNDIIRSQFTVPRTASTWVAHHLKVTSTEHLLSRFNFDWAKV